ncbi:MAG: hypothetical protein LBT82_02545 [Oscillospiraceae bacterium]|jgi:hypothetical protein|nr:hypothetical protein [Oscillospiraceae bacterium]
MSKKQIFRKSSLDRISSPEKLNDYIKVSNPSVWLIISALFVLIVIGFVWASVGSLPTNVQAVGVFASQNKSSKSADQVECFLKESYVTGETVGDEEGNANQNFIVKIGQTVNIYPVGSSTKDDSGITGVIKEINTSPLTIEEVLKLTNEPFAKKIAAKEGVSESFFKAKIDLKKNNSSNNTAIESGSQCNLKIEVESVTPISFLFG